MQGLAWQEMRSGNGNELDKPIGGADKRDGVGMCARERAGVHHARRMNLGVQGGMRVADEEPRHAPFDRCIDSGADVSMSEGDFDAIELELSYRMMHLNAEVLCIGRECCWIVVVSKDNVRTKACEMIDTSHGFEVTAVNDVVGASTQQRLDRALCSSRLAMAVGEDPKHRRRVTERAVDIHRSSMVGLCVEAMLIHE